MLKCIASELCGQDGGVVSRGFATPRQASLIRTRNPVGPGHQCNDMQSSSGFTSGPCLHLAPIGIGESAVDGGGALHNHRTTWFSSTRSSASAQPPNRFHPVRRRNQAKSFKGVLGTFHVSLGGGNSPKVYISWWVRGPVCWPVSVGTPNYL